MDTKRALPLSGVVFVVLAVLAVVVLGGDTPSNDASAAEVLSFYDAHSVRQGIAAFVLAVSVPFLVFFGVSIATAAWPEGADRRPVWQYVLIGGSGLAGAVLSVRPGCTSRWPMAATASCHRRPSRRSTCSTRIRGWPSTAPSA